MSQNQHPYTELLARRQQVADLQAQLATRDAEIKRLKERVTGLTDEVNRLNMVIELNNATMRDAF